MDKAIVCDLDGVVFEFLGFDSLDEFYQNIEYCVPNDWAVHLIKGIQKQGIKILFLTARDSKCRGITEYQLRQCFDFNIHLDMRLHNDTRPDYEMKKDYIEQYIKKYDILFCIDDNKKNCDMYASFGLTTLFVK